MSLQIVLISLLNLHQLGIAYLFGLVLAIVVFLFGIIAYVFAAIISASAANNRTGNMTSMMKAWAVPGAILLVIGLINFFVNIRAFGAYIGEFFDELFDGDIEYDSMINPPRNREAGYPRVGRYVADPEARERIQEIVKKWIKK